MGNWTTWGDMKNRVRDGVADYTDTFFSIEEIEAALNDGLKQLYQIVKTHNVGFFFNTTPEVITLTPGVQYYPLTNLFGEVDRIEPVLPENKYKRFIYKNRHKEEFRYLATLGSDVTFGDVDTFYFDVVEEKTLFIVPNVTSSMGVNVWTVQEPANLPIDANGDASTALIVRDLFRPVITQYAIRKLKGKEETGEYTSDETLLSWMFENISKYIEQRVQTNIDHVEEF